MMGAESPSTGGQFQARVFHVCLHGTGLAIKVDGCWQSVGFYKNEAVLALSAEQAIESAAARIHDLLKAGPDVFEVDWDSFNIEVDSWQADFRFWRLLERQGFIFYPIEDPVSSSE